MEKESASMVNAKIFAMTAKEQGKWRVLMCLGYVFMIVSSTVATIASLLRKLR
jgi:hypothetical protein